MRQCSAKGFGRPLSHLVWNLSKPKFAPPSTPVGVESPTGLKHVEEFQDSPLI